MSNRHRLFFAFVVAVLGAWAVAGNIGTAGSPTIRFDNDPTTGLFSPGAGTISISAGSTERMRFDNIGNISISSASVGIGTMGASAALDVNGGIKFGNDSNCSAGKAGTVRYTGGTPAYSYCNGSAWTPFDSAASTGGCTITERIGIIPFYYGIWGDGTYLYGTDRTYLYAITSTGTAYVNKGSIALANADWVWGDANYIYASNTAKVVSAYSFNGSTFTLLGTVTVANAVTGLYSDGTYLYVSNGAKLSAYTFNGSTFTSKGTFSQTGSTFNQVTGSSSSYLYASGTAKFDVLTFNGTTFTLKDSSSLSSDFDFATTDGSYIYFGGMYSCTYAASFNGTSINVLTSYCPGNALGGGFAGQASGGYIYIYTNIGLKVYKFDGTQFILKGTYTNYVSPRTVWVDASYVYYLDTVGGYGAYVIPKCN